MEAAMLQEHGWSSLPVDLLILILNRLRWSSHPSFALVCRQWRSAVSPFYPAWITPLLLNTADVGATNVQYYSPYFKKSFEVGDKLVEAPRAKISCANGRYVTLWQPGLVLNVDLLTDIFYPLRPMPREWFEYIVSDGMGKMFGVSCTVAMQVIAGCTQNSKGGWKDWEYYYIGEPGIRASPMCNHVFHGGLLYLLLEDGRLAIYDERKEEQGFEVLNKPESFGSDCDDSYLVESDQHELMAVRVGRRGTPINVFKLNEQTMEWEKMETLEGRTLFTGTLTTIMKNTAIKWMQNKIFLPRLYDWPDAVYAECVECDGEFAFVPNSRLVDANMARVGNEADIWSYELGRPEKARDFWETREAVCNIWVDFSNI